MIVQDRIRVWAAALSVLALTLLAVVLDLFDRSVRGDWSRHPFTSSVVSGLLVLLLTVLFVDRVNQMRRIKDHSRAVGAQAAVIVAQAGRAADAITRPSRSDEDRDEASQELRTYMQMLLTSAPVLIEAKASRTFLEASQHTAAELYRALRARADDHEADIHTTVNVAIQELNRLAAPLVKPLNREQRAAVATDDSSDASDG